MLVTAGYIYWSKRRDISGAKRLKIAFLQNSLQNCLQKLQIKNQINDNIEKMLSAFSVGVVEASFRSQGLSFEDMQPKNKCMFFA
jgi:hypothetical protein